MLVYYNQRVPMSPLNLSHRHWYLLLTLVMESGGLDLNVPP